MAQSRLINNDCSEPDIEQHIDDIFKGMRNIIRSKYPGMTKEEKEDLEQDVKLKIIRMLAHGKKIKHMKSYIWKAIYTSALDIIGKRMNPIPPQDLGKNSPSPLVVFINELNPQILIEKQEKVALVRAAIDSLPRRKKAVLLLHISGLEREEIAEHLGWSENTVRHLLYRGIGDIKKRFLKQSRLGAPAKRLRPEKEQEQVKP